jgi:hypothetical protein
VPDWGPLHSACLTGRRCLVCGEAPRQGSMIVTSVQGWTCTTLQEERCHALLQKQQQKFEVVLQIIVQPSVSVNFRLPDLLS